MKLPLQPFRRIERVDETAIRLAITDQSAAVNRRYRYGIGRFRALKLSDGAGLIQ